MSRTYVSFSQLSKYLRCPLAYYFEYVEELPKIFVSSSQVLGSAVHEALAAYHRRLMQGEPLDADATHDELRKSWDDQVQRSSVRYRASERPDDLKDQGIALVDAYLAEPPPENVIAVEQRLLAPISNSQGEILDKPLLAVVDLVVRERDDLAVMDFKTSGRAYSELEALTSLQPTCYVNNVSLLYGVLPSFRFAVLIKTRKPRVQIVSANRDEADLGRLGDVVQMVERAIGAGIFYPIETPLNCSSCPYRTPCREWGPAPAAPTLQPSLSILRRAKTC
jgi:putative RecB family exonuclease